MTGIACNNDTLFVSITLVQLSMPLRDMALVLGTAANTPISTAWKEQHPEATNSVSVDKVDEALNQQSFYT